MKLREFKSDLKKQCIVLMGLPAAGKSTFIETDIKKYFSGFSGYKTVNSDVTIGKFQYEVATNHYKYLLGTSSDHEVLEFSKNANYTTNQGKEVDHPITAKWWNDNKDKGIKFFYKTFKPPYYTNYFDIRSFAKAESAITFDTKIKKAGNFLIVDTTAAHPGPLLKKIKQIKADGFNVTVIYLRINPKYSIARDVYRGKNQGRTVGADVILGYVLKMKNAISSYESEGSAKDGVIDRIMIFDWSGKADPRYGKWVKKSDVRYSLKRDTRKENKNMDESKLRKIIREEIQKLNEIVPYSTPEAQRLSANRVTEFATMLNKTELKIKRLMASDIVQGAYDFFDVITSSSSGKVKGTRDEMKMIQDIANSKEIETISRKKHGGRKGNFDRIGAQKSNVKGQRGGSIR
jgi:predicted ABC-type ATPase